MLGTPRSLGDFENTIIMIVNYYIVPILVALSLVAFLWGIAKTIGSESPDTRATGRKTMIYGLISMFVIVSLWGILYAASRSLFGGLY